MSAIDQIILVDPDANNDIAIEFNGNNDGDSQTHCIYVADSSWTLVIKDDVLLIEK